MGSKPQKPFLHFFCLSQQVVLTNRYVLSTGATDAFGAVAIWTGDPRLAAGDLVDVTTFSSREFNQAASQAKRAANIGPVFITGREKAAHVLMSIGLYERVTGSRQKISDLLAVPGAESIEFDAVRSRELDEPADLP